MIVMSTAIVEELPVVLVFVCSILCLLQLYFYCELLIYTRADGVGFGGVKHPMANV
jgi:hypothetical protein